MQVERGFGAAWHLQQIEVLNKKTGARHLFRYNDWLKDAKTTVTIPESTSDAAKAAAPGKVRVGLHPHCPLSALRGFHRFAPLAPFAPPG